MIPEYAHFSLILALALALLLAVLPLLGAIKGDTRLMNTARPLAAGQFVFVLVSFIGLAWAFATDDFSVITVAQNSNSQLPMQFKLSAVWGNHEGSILLWILVHASWTLAVAIFSRQLPQNILSHVLSTMGMISIGFILFSLLTSNPFERLFPNVPLDGNDLNPLLQDIGLIIHPPLLYFGYVGFSVAFSFAIAALSTGQLDSAWARWSRPWTNIAWAFLTVGIALGSWWAYYELGWGGWWFWDPVENASFMPWLVGTALIHSLAVTEKRGVFKSWTVLLAIFAFSLSLLGTFLVRSGVLTSVHAFASDPDRGLFILIYLLVVIGGSLTLYALRVPQVRSRVQFAYMSREFFLLLNNVLFIVAALTVLLGTLFPLLMDALGQGRYSVGPPYFNSVFVPLMAMLFALVGLGPQSRWKSTSREQLLRPLLVAAIASLTIAVIAPFLLPGSFKVGVVIGVLLSSWVMLTSVVQLRSMIRTASGGRDWRRLRPAQLGMLLGHVGIAVTALGVVLTSHYTTEQDLRMKPGDSVSAGGYEVLFVREGVERVSNYQAEYGIFELRRNGIVEATLRPEKRRYPTQQNVMTEAAIDAGMLRDMYIALGEKLEGDAWAVRVHYKAFVRFIWLGALIMALGGVVAVMDKRYRKVRVAEDERANPKASTVAAGARA
ncbi:MAG: heme lyase CcmF/NrfE family subunit [Pseudomonadales bacterium]